LGLPLFFCKKVIVVAGLRGLDGICDGGCFLPGVLYGCLRLCSLLSFRLVDSGICLSDDYVVLAHKESCD